MIPDTPTVPLLVLQWQVLAASRARCFAARAPWLDADMISLAMTALWRSAESYVAKFDPADPRPFSPLVRVAVNRSCERRLRLERLRNRWAFQPQADPDLTHPADLIPARELAVGAEMELADLLAVLDEGERRVVEKWLEGMTFEEIGTALALTSWRARMTFRRAKGKLRRLLSATSA